MTMRHFIPVALAASVLAVPAMAWAQAACPLTRFNFEADPIGKPPQGFQFAKTGVGRAGRWVIQTDASAPDGSKVVAQVDADAADYRFPVAVVEERQVRDARISAEVKMVSGKVDQAAGLVFRYQDANNYYITRANALEDNVRLYCIVNGQRKQIAGWDGEVTANAWHSLEVYARGATLKVLWDGRTVIDTTDRSFQTAGKLGFWTKADSVTRFDDLRIIRMD